MPRYDASSSAEVLVFTFKDGLLSAMAHDLKLRVTRFTIDVEGGAVRGEFDAGSLKVLTPMKDGAEHAGLLPTPLYGEIEKNAANEVLAQRAHPVIRFESTTLGEAEVSGRLTLHGQTRDVRGTRQGNTAEFSLDVRDFGIKPYTAMLGTLKVKPVVRVRVTLPSV